MHERIAGLYEKNAAAFDRQRSRGLMERAWLERFAGLVPKGARVLDMGCGMGEPVDRWLIERGFDLTGIDISPTLLAYCKARFPEHRWQVGDMRTVDLGSKFDGLVAWHSLIHLTREDQRAMFPRFQAHSAPGAALMFTSGPEAGESVGEWQGEPLYHASLSPEEYRRLLARNGFDLVAHQPEDSACGGATVWLAVRRRS